MSSGTQNAQKFAAVISIMVLRPSSFDMLMTFFGPTSDPEFFRRGWNMARLAPPPEAAAPPVGALWAPMGPVGPYG